MIQVLYNRGIYLPQLDLWLDPWDEQACAFVSHGHSDHIGAHREIIMSSVTARLLAARLPGERIEQAHSFGERFVFRGAEIILYPAGHIFGSAQIHITWQGSTLLYTGDFKMRPGRSAEPIEWAHADTLIMETTYGLPQYVFPPTELILEQLTTFCAEALDEGATPVLFGYSLGKAQEILSALPGFRILLHPAVFGMTQLYREMARQLPDYHLYSADLLAGSVVICPPSANRTRLVQSIKNRRTAVLTGWALQPGAVYRYQCDAAFALSDHADYPDLLRYVQAVAPARVLTVHGYMQEFAQDLRRRGVEAWALAGDNQLELAIDPSDAVELPATGPITTAQPQEGFDYFTSVCEQIGQTSRKIQKVNILAGYLRTLDSSELPIVCIFLTGHAFARSDNRILQVGWAVIKRALVQATGVTETQFRRTASGYGDAGKIAYEILLQTNRAEKFSIGEAYEQFEALQSAAGPIGKSSVLADWLKHASPDAGSYIIRILTGDLRIGLKEGLVEEAVAEAFSRDVGAVREAHMLTGHLGETALLAKENNLGSATITLFRPIKCMLAISESTGEAIWERVSRDLMGKRMYAEQKYDGIRAQLHARPGKTELFSRDLRNISTEFPELSSLDLGQEIILDGEILAFSENKKLTFFDLQRRLGRKGTSDLFENRDVPVILQAFDLLWLDGRSLLRNALTERRRELEQLGLPSSIRISPLRDVGSAEQIEEAFLAARRAKTEGLMVKDPDSPYTPGRRGGNWIKLKKEFATLDVVVVGAEYGHGKRSHVLSDYTFAVRDAAGSSLLTIGKAYSGLTDAEIEELTEHFLRTTLRSHGSFREVVPEVVLEIAFDSIQPSDRHSSGLALRFPRIKAIRRDKRPTEIDSLEHARRLAGLTSQF